MSVVLEPDEEELYLLAILLDDTGIDIAEFMFLNEENPHGRFRCWDYQFSWWVVGHGIQKSINLPFPHGPVQLI